VLERAVAAVSAEHRLADAPLLDPADLKDSLLWMPAAATSSELLGVWRRFAEHFGIAMDTGGQNLGLGTPSTSCVATRGGSRCLVATGRSPPRQPSG
jgi:hypothetical protein